MTGSRADIRDALRSALSDGGFALSKVPEYTRDLIQVEGWLPEFNNLQELVEGPVRKGGFHSDMKHLRNLCADDPTTLDLIDQAMQRPPGGSHANVDNIHNDPRPDGTSRARALRRLRKDAPRLHAKVLAGKISPNAAAIEAGFRKKTKSVPIDSPHNAIRALARVFELDELAQAIKELSSGNRERSTP